MHLSFRMCCRIGFPGIGSADFTATHRIGFPGIGSADFTATQKMRKSFEESSRQHSGLPHTFPFQHCSSLSKNPVP